MTKTQCPWCQFYYPLPFQSRYWIHLSKILESVESRGLYANCSYPNHVRSRQRLPSRQHCRTNYS